MSAQIELKQWTGATVTPKDDACMYDAMLGDSGIITGCDLTSLGSGQVRIGSGRGVIKGRQFVILEHTITVPLSQSGTKAGRIYIHMDLAQATPISIMSETAATLTPLIQEEDCNLTNGEYEVELGTYTAGVSAISDLTKTISAVNGYQELKEEIDFIADNLEDNSKSFKFGYDMVTGRYGYYKDGADTVTPFRGEFVIPKIELQGGSYVTTGVTNKIQINIADYDKLKIQSIVCSAGTCAIAGDQTSLNYQADTEIDISSYSVLAIIWAYGSTQQADTQACTINNLTLS